MATAQQYSVSIRGYQPLYDWIRAHTWRMHSPPGDHDVTITVGSNNTLEVCASLLVFVRAACLLLGCPGCCQGQCQWTQAGLKTACGSFTHVAVSAACSVTCHKPASSKQHCL